MAFNDYENMNPYHQYGDPDDPSPYELLNQMKSWDKAIRLTVTALSEETQAQLTILEDQITASVIDINQQIITQVGVLNGKIELKVTKGETIADINITQGAIRIRADKVNLDGYATFSSLTTAGQTVINGANIMTGTIVADKIGAGQIIAGKLATNAVSASNIQTDAVQASHIYSGAVTAGKIASYAIQGYHINSYAITADKIQAGAINAGHITASGLSADVIRGGILSGVYLQIDTDATVGSNLYLGGNSGYKSVNFGNGGRIDYNGSQMTLSANYLNLDNSNLDINSYTTIRGTLSVPSTTNLSGLVRAESSGIGISYASGRLYVKENGITRGSVALT